MNRDPNKIGVLISNLGTPDAPTTEALKRYLKEFLSDRRVVDVPRPVWFFILNFLILPTRAPVSAKNYKSVWTAEGSPLLVFSKSLFEKISKRLLNEANNPTQMKFAFGMRYGNPSLEDALDKLSDCGKILNFALYPQYSSATTASTIDKIFEILKKRRHVPDIKTIMSYHDHPAYIQALVDSIETHQKQNGKPQKLLFSFHGIPKRYLREGDPYFYECHKTAKLVADKLKLNETDWQVSFQSRFGKEEWLKPYTDETLKMFPKRGIKSVQVICPGFSVDCLETIEEIGEENRDYFMGAGGESYEYIAALNDADGHVAALCEVIKSSLKSF